MRLLHLADTHLGFRQFAGRLDPERQINQREADVYRSWHHAIDHAIAAGVDVVVHAGDLFDSPRPTPRALAEALDGLARLRDAGIPAIVIAGNHSTPRTRSGGSVFEVLGRFPGVHPIWQGPTRIDIVGTSFHAFPHESDPERLRGHIAALEPGPGRNVLIAHGGLETAKATYGEARAIELDAETIATAAVDYVALGHLHAHQIVQANAAYCGSLERLDFADVADKVLVEVDLDAPGGSAGFLTRHEAPARSVFTVAVDCSGLGPSEAFAAIEAGVGAHDCTDAVVRLRLDGLARDVYQALDTRRLAALLEPALHHVLVVGSGVLHTGDGEPEEGMDFDAFARERIPSGVDVDRVLALARGFLRDAGAEEVERGAGG
jgi:exonuclease SbcD